MDRITPKDAEGLAKKLVGMHPTLYAVEDAPTVARAIADFCLRLTLGRDNDRRIEVCNALLRKRDRGEPWTDEDEDQADFYGVSGPRQRLTVDTPAGPRKLTIAQSQALLAEGLGDGPQAS